MQGKHLRPENRRIERNPSGGRDFVIGDVHGEFRTLERLLDAVAFDASCDRLFSVGDLIDRGPDSGEALDWLTSGKITAATRGNHEQWLLERLDAEALGDAHVAWTSQPWFAAEVPADDHPAWREALSQMPLTLNVRVAHGNIGIVHAAPVRRSWEAMIELLRAGSGDSGWLALNSTARAKKDEKRAEHEGVPIRGEIFGIRAVMTGHCIATKVRRSANVWHLDTGAGMRGGKLSVARIDQDKIETVTIPTGR